jgi:hypothetical protein
LGRSEQPAGRRRSFEPGRGAKDRDFAMYLGIGGLIILILILYILFR